MYNYVDISGYGHSGKSVMIDLLKEVEGFHVPDYFFEFDLVRIQGGLADLKNNIYENWSPVRSDAAVKRFQNVVNRMGMISTLSSPISKVKAYGTQYEKIFNGIFFDETKKYLDSIIVSKSIRNDWPFMRVDESYLKIFIYKLLHKFSLHEKFINKYLTEYNFVPPENFLPKTQKYLDNLFSSTVSDNNVHTIVLNNTFEPFNPTKSMELFNNAKCIIIQRDPRDIYASTMMPNQGFIPEFLKSPEHWQNKQGFLMVNRVDSFIDNQLSNYNSVNTDLDFDRVLRLRYEDLIIDYDKVILKIFNFLEINEENHIRKKQFFSPEKSKLNIGLWKNFHDQKAINKIMERLENFCYKS